MRLSSLLALLTFVLACNAYDPDLIKPGDGGWDSGHEGDASDNDAGEGECRQVPDSNCDLVCVERCNGKDDDCDGMIDNNGAASSCNIPNAEATCDEGECRLVRCQGEFADCNGLEEDGCEASLQASPTSCGLCGATCSFLNATALCEQGVCLQGECEEGFGDCDGQPSNGCETSLYTLTTCGSCMGRCEVGDNALPTCETGVCEVGECVGNFADCDGMPENGCEQPLDDPDNCGACGVNCSTLPNATAECGETGCEGVTCVGDFLDCDGLAPNGCEATLNTPDNCGACGMVCDLPNVAVHLCDSTATATCVIDDTADNGGCDDGFADCNGDASDGCERPLNTITDCGACGSACTFTNGIGSCETGACQLVGCGEGSNDCNDDGMCDSLAEDPNNCGECGNICPLDVPVCSAGRCRVGACPANTADCDSNDTDCETDITQAATCGSCGNNCTGRPNTTGGTCSSGTCQITCATGFANCNGDIADGCETNTRTLGNCGGCGVTCSIANATATCSTGTCLVDTCASTHRDCDMNNTSCETSISQPATCGSCTNNCMGKPNTSGAGCNTNGTCALTCASGFRDCNGTVSDGCEVAINTTANCGGCGTNCAALPNVAAAACGSNGCMITTCATGFADCDGLPSNGCERSITTLTDCGACNAVCNFANATPTCSGAGVCTQGTCSAGFGDCTSANGCETQLNTTSNCGMCGRTCATGETCNNGVCAVANCPSGFSLCGGSTCIDIRGSCPPWPGCLNTKPNKNNCGSCGFRCPLYGGDHCCI